MLRVRGKLSEASFSKPTVSLCYSEQGKMLGYVLRFDDFYLYLSEYIAQLVNIWGFDENVSTKRKLDNKPYVLKADMEDKILSQVEGNSLLLTSLSLYLNNKVSKFIVLNKLEWGSLSKSRKLFICYLLSSRQYVIILLRIYEVCSESEKHELFALILSLVGTYHYKLSFTEENVDIVQKSANIENLSDSSSIKTIEPAQEKVENIGQVFTEKIDTLTVVERTFGKFHIHADTEFYDSLVEVYNIVPPYRGRTSWKNILIMLRDNPKYSAITAKYINDSGYKLNENNLRNWYNYYTNNSLKTDKFKIISDTSEIIELFSDMNYNNRDI